MRMNCLIPPVICVVSDEDFEVSSSSEDSEREDDLENNLAAYFFHRFVGTFPRIAI